MSRTNRYVWLLYEYIKPDHPVIDDGVLIEVFLDEETALDRLSARYEEWLEEFNQAGHDHEPDAYIQADLDAEENSAQVEDKTYLLKRWEVYDEASW